MPEWWGLPGEGRGNRPVSSKDHPREKKQSVTGKVGRFHQGIGGRKGSRPRRRGDEEIVSLKQPLPRVYGGTKRVKKNGKETGTRGPPCPSSTLPLIPGKPAIGEQSDSKKTTEHPRTQEKRPGEPTR